MENNTNLKWYEHYYKNGKWNTSNIVKLTVLLFLMIGVMSYFLGMEEEALKDKAKKEKIDSITPKNQSNFEQKLLKFKKIYNESKNDLKKQKTLLDLIDFQKEFADSTNWAFENWYGTVSFELKNIKHTAKNKLVIPTYT